MKKVGSGCKIWPVEVHGVKISGACVVLNCAVTLP